MLGHDPPDATLRSNHHAFNLISVPFLRGYRQFTSATRRTRKLRKIRRYFPDALFKNR